MLDLLKWLWSYGGFKLRGSGYPQNFSAPSGETMRHTQSFWSCKNVLEVLYHQAKFGGAWISLAAGVAKNVDFFVCLFVTLLNVRVCVPDFAMKAAKVVVILCFCGLWSEGTLLHAAIVVQPCVILLMMHTIL